MVGGFGSVFLMFAGVLGVVVFVILILGEETRGQTLEDINH